MDFQFRAIRGSNPGYAGTVHISDGRQSVEVPYYTRGMCLYVDLEEACGRLVLSRDVYFDLKRYVSAEYDLWTSSDVRYCAGIDKRAERWERLCDRYPRLWTLRRRASYLVWVSFRPLRHWLKPLMQDKYHG